MTLPRRGRVNTEASAPKDRLRVSEDAVAMLLVALGYPTRPPPLPRRGERNAFLLLDKDPDEDPPVA